MTGSARRLHTDLKVIAALSVLYWLLVGLTWGRAGDIGADLFSEQTAAFRVESGERLYHEIQWLYGPVVVWLLVGIRAVFGRTVETFLALAAVFAWIEWVLAYLLARKRLGTGLSVSLVALFWSVFTFSAGIFGRLPPYSLAALIAGVLFLGTVCLLWPDEKAHASRRLLLSSLMATTAILTKFEIGAAACVIVGTESAVRLWKDRTSWLPPVIATILPAAAWLTAWTVSPGFREFTDPRPVMASDLGRRYLIFSGSLLSVESVSHFLLTLVCSSALMILLSASTGLLSGRKWKPGLAALAAALAIPAILNALLPMGMDRPLWPRITAHLSWACFIPALVWQLKDGIRRKGEGVAITLGLLLLVIRVPNALMPNHMGSLFLVPVVAAALPNLAALAAAFSRSRVPPAVVLGILAATSLPATGRNLNLMLEKSVVVHEATGPVRASPARAEVFRNAIDYLRSHLKPGDRIAVAPNETVLYYATGALPVWPDHNYIGHMVRGDFEPALAAQAMRDARFVVVTNRPFIGFGLATRAGSGFAVELMRLLDSEAKLVADFTPVENRTDRRAPFQIRIWETRAGGRE